MCVNKMFEKLFNYNTKIYYSFVMKYQKIKRVSTLAFALRKREKNNMNL